MKKRHVLAVACSLALAWSTAALGQLAPANDMGVALGHIHLAVKEVEANKQFFTTMPGGKLAPTKGRAIDHLGFDVKNLDEFEKRIAALGIKVEAPPRVVPNTRTKVAFLTDPWGTYIEVTEKLAPEAPSSVTR